MTGGVPIPAAAQEQTLPIAQVASVDTFRDGQGQTYAVLSIAVPGAAITAAIPEAAALRFADAIRAAAAGISLS